MKNKKREREREKVAVDLLLFTVACNILIELRFRFVLQLFMT